MMWRLVRTYADSQMERAAQWTCDMLNASVETAKEIGCSPEAVVAQAALETGWGRASIGNNVFGIKAGGGWNGAKVLQRTAEQTADGEVYFVNDYFRDYPTLADGINDHFLFLKQNSRYANVFDPDGTMSDHEYFARLQRDGYATDIHYADKLDSMLASVQVFERGMVQGDGAPDPKPTWRLLMAGMEGPDVAKVQSALASLGYYKLAIDGDFGPGTRRAVVDFQYDRGLTADGIVGNETRGALNL